MEQYYSSDSDTIKDKNGIPLRVSPIRKRRSYASIASALVRDKEGIRVDLLADRLVGGLTNIGQIIDCNTQDVLSLSNGDKVYFAK